MTAKPPADPHDVSAILDPMDAAKSAKRPTAADDARWWRGVGMLAVGVGPVLAGLGAWFPPLMVVGGGVTAGGAAVLGWQRMRR